MQHHAYYIEDSLARFEELEARIRRDAHIEPNDPGFLAREYEKFGIDEARQLIDMASLKNTGEQAIYFFGISSMTSEAQQALLKLFEEPQEGTTFILLVPHGMLLPTLKSRMLEFGGEERESQSSGEGRDFLTWPYKKRSEWIVVFLKDDESARERTRALFTELEAELYKRMDMGRDVREGLEDLSHFRQYLGDRSPSLKMILEHLAATLPTLK